MDEPEEINTINDGLVGVTGGDRFVIMRRRPDLSRDEALRLAAWLVFLADPLGDDFDRLRAAIEHDG